MDRYFVTRIISSILCLLKCTLSVSEDYYNNLSGHKILRNIDMNYYDDMGFATIRRIARRNDESLPEDYQPVRRSEDKDMSQELLSKDSNSVNKENTETPVVINIHNVKDFDLILRKRVKPIYLKSRDLILFREKDKDKVWAKYYYYGEPHCQIGTIWNIECFTCLCLVGGKSYCTNIGNTKCLPADLEKDQRDKFYHVKVQKCMPGSISHEDCMTCTCLTNGEKKCLRDRGCAEPGPVPKPE